MGSWIRPNWALAGACLFLMAAGARLAGREGAPHWSYAGETGPARWGTLSESYALCAGGRSQSPIDLTGAVIAPLPPLKFHYQSTDLDIVNNGHTIQVDYQPGSYLSADGQDYDLLQFHFHSPSEHTIDGLPYDMVAHLVHSNASGELLVVAILMEARQEHPLVQTIWGHLPEDEGLRSIPAGVSINVMDFIPLMSSYFTYSGSLTTPPCTEGVRWIVLDTPVKVSVAQVEHFNSFFPRSTRPVQPLNGRVIRKGVFSR
ncbi:MAG: carbonic anhydrase family protein [Candidatus Marinimicrobia bacterium]|nr:carbonic anhydrase family protein [Candidatus Neomarinimicrobiota bacterium]